MAQKDAFLPSEEKVFLLQHFFKKKLSGRSFGGEGFTYFGNHFGPGLVFFRI